MTGAAAPTDTFPGAEKQKSIATSAATPIYEQKISKVRLGTMNRFHDNLIYGLHNIDCSRPLQWNDPYSPRVLPRPINVHQIVSWWGRIKAAWLVFTLEAVALRWYDDTNVHKYGQCWYERHGINHSRITDNLGFAFGSGEGQENTAPRLRGGS